MRLMNRAMELRLYPLNNGYGIPLKNFTLSDLYFRLAVWTEGEGARLKVHSQVKR